MLAKIIFAFIVISGLASLAPDREFFVVFLLVSVICRTFAVEIVAMVHLHLATFHPCYCSCSGTEVRLGGSIKLKRAFKACGF